MCCGGTCHCYMPSFTYNKNVPLKHPLPVKCLQILAVSTHSALHFFSFLLVCQALKEIVLCYYCNSHS